MVRRPHKRWEGDARDGTNFSPRRTLTKQLPWSIQRVLARPIKTSLSSPSLSLSSMLEARRSELLGRARARAYGERTTTSPTEKSPCYVSLLCSYIEGWCARVYRLRGGRGWQRRVRTEREREREAFVSRAFGYFRRHPARCTCARENVDIAALVWLVSSPPLSLFDEATASSTHRHRLLLLHHPQPFLLLFPSLPFLTTGLPALSLLFSLPSQVLNTRRRITLVGSCTHV